MTGRYSFISYDVSRGSFSHFSSSQHYSIQSACLLYKFTVYLTIDWCSRSLKWMYIYTTTTSIFYTFYTSCFDDALFIVFDVEFMLLLFAVLLLFLLVACLSALITFVFTLFYLLTFCFCNFYDCCCCYVFYNNCCFY